MHITLLGDSYSAGTGAGSYYGDEGSYRSHNNWAHKYVDWLNDQGAPAILTNLAFNGGVTNDLLKDRGQISQIPTDTDVVMFTIGGNDVHFSDIVKQCFTLGIRDPETCKQKVDAANSGLADVRGGVIGS
nr:GDSL-type esterase/lipase family protein [Actinomyces bowdenii]